MRILVAILLVTHALIHVLGFLKAFKIIELNLLNSTISKAYGIYWLIAAIFFLITTLLLLFKSNYWWLFGFLSVLISQIIIIVFWKEAKFGTMLNLIIWLACMFAYGNFSFSKQVKEEVVQMLSKVELNKKKELMRVNSIEDVPMPVQNWLRNCGVNNTFQIKSVYLKQKILMKLKPQQKKWYKATAQQYFTTYPAAFNWSVAMNINSIISMKGRDKLENGNGEMMIKMGSIIPIVNVKNNKKVNEATLQRFLAEIVWFPSAALSSYISWEYIDERSAKATISMNNISTSGTFFFSENGEFKKFSTLRYKDLNDVQPKEWEVEVIKNKVFNKIKIPEEIHVTWKLEDGDFTWLQLKITEIYYNIPAGTIINTY